jgi:hypothetical protein
VVQCRPASSSRSTPTDAVVTPGAQNSSYGLKPAVVMQAL